MVITIDGLSTNGKTTLAKKIAKTLGFRYFNTGAIYRCIALIIIDRNLDIDDIDSVIESIRDIKVDFEGDRTLLNGADVTNRIKKSDISYYSTMWAMKKELKDFVRQIQRDFINGHDTVIEGRDIAVRVAPEADIKFYLYSDFETRVLRLYNSLDNISIEEVRENLSRIDGLDYEENFVEPNGAIKIDTTHLSIDEVYEIMIDEIRKI